MNTRTLKDIENIFELRLDDDTQLFLKKHYVQVLFQVLKNKQAKTEMDINYNIEQHNQFQNTILSKNLFILLKHRLLYQINLQNFEVHKLVEAESDSYIFTLNNCQYFSTNDGIYEIKNLKLLLHQRIINNQLEFFTYADITLKLDTGVLYWIQTDINDHSHQIASGLVNWSVLFFGGGIMLLTNLSLCYKGESYKIQIVDLFTTNGVNPSLRKMYSNSNELIGITTLNESYVDQYGINLPEQWFLDNNGLSLPYEKYSKRIAVRNAKFSDYLQKQINQLQIQMMPSNVYQQVKSKSGNSTQNNQLKISSSTLQVQHTFNYNSMTLQSQQYFNQVPQSMQQLETEQQNSINAQSNAPTDEIILVVANDSRQSLNNYQQPNNTNQLKNNHSKQLQDNQLNNDQNQQQRQDIVLKQSNNLANINNQQVIHSNNQLNSQKDSNQSKFLIQKNISVDNQNLVKSHENIVSQPFVSISSTSSEQKMQKTIIKSQQDQVQKFVQQLQSVQSNSTYDQHSNINNNRIILQASDKTEQPAREQYNTWQTVKFISQTQTKQQQDQVKQFIQQLKSQQIVSNDYKKPNVADEKIILQVVDKTPTSKQNGQPELNYQEQLNILNETIKQQFKQFQQNLMTEFEQKQQKLYEIINKQQQSIEGLNQRIDQQSSVLTSLKDQLDQNQNKNQEITQKLQGFELFAKNQEKMQESNQEMGNQMKIALDNLETMIQCIVVTK